MENNQVIQIGDNTKKPVERYVALLQYKNEERGYEILKDLPKNKNELKAMLLAWFQNAGLPAESALAEIFLVDKLAVDAISDWCDWKVSIEEVYRVCIDSWKIKKWEIDLDEHRGSFNDFMAVTDFKKIKVDN